MKKIMQNDKILISSLNYINDIYGYCNNITRIDFMNEPMIADACLMKITVIGENVSRFSNDFRNKYDKIP